MKKIAIILLLTISLFVSSSLALEIPGPKSSIYNENINEAINTDNIDNPLRDGSFMIIDNQKVKLGDEQAIEIKGIVNVWDIQSHNQAKENILNILKNIINYALGLLGLIALIYLLAHGFMILTAAWDDEKYKKGLKGIKYASIALGGIGLSFFMIKFVFRLINIVINGRG